jgi:hypothetical protein
MENIQLARSLQRVHRCAKLSDEKLHVISILSRLSVRDALRAMRYAFCATEQFCLSIIVAAS